ncbi:hypothetical protein [Herminiimonas sp. KBW02]|uniref:hypothetical protein n=1 Tax=Herminiimonas sp. KBW02 TaxID=2153363 RepID=UPI000F59C36B|nr:hypothetical protein [Herminiimonas sp. KBW02]
MAQALHRLTAEQVESLTHVKQDTQLPSSIFIAEPSIESEMARWEFEVEGEFGSAAQMLAPDWGDAADNLSCRPSKHIQNSAAQVPDPYEADLPLPLSLACLVLGDTLFVAAQHPPLPAPVFRADRPPTLAV